MDYTEVETVCNATIIKGKTDGKFGVLSKEMNSIIEYPKYDAYSILPKQENTKQENNRYIVFVFDGKKGIFDAVKVEFIQPCMQLHDIKINTQKKVIEAKKPFRLFNLIKLWDWRVEIPIE